MRSLSLLLSLLSVAIAAPALLQERDTTGINPTLFARLDLFAQYAGAAGCYDNVQPNSTIIACASELGNCSSIEGKSNIVLGFSDIGATKTRGFVATDPINKLIVIGIQGTQGENIANWITDADIIQVSTSLCGTANTNDGCQIDQGFWNAANDVKSLVNASVIEAVAANPSYKIVATGHSLGAAVAAILGTMLRNDGRIVDIYTYGQPHLGPVDINTYIQSQAPSLGSNYRVTHGRDLVPQLPPHALGDWDHYYPEFWISKIDGYPAPSDINEVDGSLYETAGNEGHPATLADIFAGVPQHKLYFVNITACNADAP